MRENLEQVECINTVVLNSRKKKYIKKTDRTYCIRLKHGAPQQLRFELHIPKSLCKKGCRIRRRDGEDKGGAAIGESVVQTAYTIVNNINVDVKVMHSSAIRLGLDNSGSSGPQCKGVQITSHPQSDNRTQLTRSPVLNEVVLCGCP